MEEDKGCAKGRGNEDGQPTVQTTCQNVWECKGWLGDKRIHQANGTIQFASCSTVSKTISLDFGPHNRS